jgi:hypothetical protein
MFINLIKSIHSRYLFSIKQFSPGDLFYYLMTHELKFKTFNLFHYQYNEIIAIQRLTKNHGEFA